MEVGLQREMADATMYIQVLIYTLQKDFNERVLACLKLYSVNLREYYSFGGTICMEVTVEVRWVKTLQRERRENWKHSLLWSKQ